MKHDQKITYSVKYQAGMGIILQSTLKDMGINLKINDLCNELGIGRTTAYDGKNELIAKILDKSRDKERITDLEDRIRSLEAQILEQNFTIEIYKYTQEHPACFIDGPSRFYSVELKQYILELKDKYGFTFEKIDELIQVPVNTLKKFNKSVESLLNNPLEELPDEILKLINEYLRSGSEIKSVKAFCKKNPELLIDLKMNYRQVLSWLSKLGFVSPKGIFLKNTGLDRIIRFKPNIVWGTDGKEINVIINGVRYRWVWQCLMDYKSTVIIGGLIAPEENTGNLLTAIEASKEKTGVTPLAIVMDNRLSENLPAIKEYLDKYGIEVVKIFPGNPKSNGILENNFHIFEKWVGGKIIINGEDVAALSKSIVQMVVEIFTQQRNHKCFYNSTKFPKEIMDESKDNPPTQKEKETMKRKIDELVNRLKREETIPAISVQKQLAIEQAINEIKPKDNEVFRKRLSNVVYTHNLILEAIAIFKTRQQKHPEKRYDHTYFGGILRNLVNNQYIECLNTNLHDVYYHHYEELEKKHDKDILNNLKTNPVKILSDLVLDYLKMPVPAWSTMILLQLKEIFFIASTGSEKKAKFFCDKISSIIVKLTYEVKRKREILLCKLYEWVNYVKLYENGAQGSTK